MGISSLKKVMVKQKPSRDGVIKRLLQSYVGGYDPPRSKSRIHASELTKESGFCPRKYRLMDEYEVKDKADHIDTALQMTFDEGRDKQYRFNNDWLRPRMVGDWRCASCGKQEQFTTAPGGCSDPNMKCRWEYEEVRVEDEVTGVSGGLDALVIVAEGEKLRLVECKIMGTDQFRKLAAPLAEHRVRTQIYLRAIAKTKQKWAKQIDTSEASVLYFMRGHGMKDEDGDINPLREFTVKRDHKGVLAYFAMAQAVTESRKDPDKGLPCGICTTMMSPRAQACPVAKQCFSSKHPPTITWEVEGKPAHDFATIKWIANGTELKPVGED